MKQISLFFFLFSFCHFAISQQVPRDQVVVEVGTGTWCPYCPGAAMGIEDLLAAGYNVAPIKYHSGDDYQNTASTHRISYYNISGFPTAVFDGLSSVVGGSGSQSMYSSYLPHVNQRNNIPSSFTLSLSGSVIGNTYSVTIEAVKVAVYSHNQLKLHLVLTESHIPEYWQGQTELNNVERMMIPDHLGTSLDFSSQSQHSVNLSFTLSDSYEVANCELVCFLQNPNTKEIAQGTKIPLTDLLPTLAYDIGLKHIGNIPVRTCIGSMIPEVILQNYGNTALTSTTLYYSVNNGSLYSYEWTGNLPSLGRDTLQLPAAQFDVTGQNELSVWSGNPNGIPDQNTANDTLSAIFPQTSSYFQGPLVLVLKTDGNPQETTWELTNSAGNVVYSGGPYTEANKVFIIPLEVSAEDCYRFVIQDAGKNGICCTNGNGLYKIADKNNLTIHTGNHFLMSETIDFRLSGTTGILMTDLASHQVSFSRPDRKLNIGNESYQYALSFRVTDLTGRSFLGGKAAPGENLSLDAGTLTPGLYLVHLTQNGVSETRKLMILND